MCFLFKGFYLFTCILLYFFKAVIISSLRCSIIVKRWGFRSESCFSGVLGYPGLAVVQELGSGGADLYWLLPFLFLYLPLVISGVNWPGCL